MQFQFAHYNYNVLNLEKSLAFYKEALGLEEPQRSGGRQFYFGVSHRWRYRF